MADRGITDGEALKVKTWSEIFRELFPHYLAMGMTREEYWDMDCTLVIPYREAWKIKQEHENHMAWLQGLYIYDALSSVPIIVQGFAKKGAKQREYPNEPYEFADQKTDKKSVTNKADKEAKQKAEMIRAKMSNFASSFNAKRKAEEERQQDERKE